MKDFEEDPIDAVQFLLWKARSIIESDDLERNVGKLNLVVGDFFDKLSSIDLDIGESLIERLQQVLDGHEDLVGDKRAFHDLQEFESESKSERKRARAHADVVILTVINTEFEAALRTFGILGTEPSFRIRGRALYKCVLGNRKYRRRALNVYIAMIGEPRNVQCANICRDVAEELDVDLFVLCGIAGANRDNEVELVQAVAPFSVFYVEGGKRRRAVRLVGWLPRKKDSRSDKFLESLGGILGYSEIHDPEVLTSNMTDPVKAYLEEFRPDLDAVKSMYRKTLDGYKREDVPDGTEQAIDSYQCHRDNLMCGEKVVGDDSVRVVASKVNRKISAVDMESHGFAATCEHIKKQWIIFRGLSDYSDPKKDDDRHIGASISAAVSAYMFLAKTYVLPEEVHEF